MDVGRMIADYGLAVLLALIGAGGLWKLFDAVARRRALGGRSTIQVVALSTEQRQWFDQLQERVEAADRQADRSAEHAAAARRLLTETMESAGKLRAEVSDLTAQVHALTRQVATVRGWIHDPGMTIDRLRFLVPPPVLPSGSPNGI